MVAISAASAPPSFLGTRRAGKLTLALVCAVAFIDLLDASIVSISRCPRGSNLHFSVQSLQWVSRARTCSRLAGFPVRRPRG